MPEIKRQMALENQIDRLVNQRDALGAERRQHRRSHPQRCPAMCKRSGKCYGKAYFTGKPGKVNECDPECCPWEGGNK